MNHHQKLVLYQKYHNVLLIRLQKFLNEHLETLKSGSVEDKLKFVEDLKPSLEDSAILNRKMPKHLHFLKSIFKKIDSLLYSSNGLLNRLKKGDLQKIEKKEEKIVNYLRKKLKHIKLPKLTPEHTTQQEIYTVYYEATHNIPQGPNKFALAVTLISMCFLMMCVTPALAQVANEGFTKKEKRVERIEKIKSFFNKDLAQVFTFSKPKEIPKKIKVAPEKDELEPEPSERDVLIKSFKEDAVAWAKAIGLLNEQISDKLVELDAKLAGEVLKTHISSILDSTYTVTTHHYDSKIDTIFIPLKYQPVDEITSKLHSSELDRHSIGVRPAINETYLETIEIGFSREMDLVIVLTETIIGDGKKTFKQTNVVIHHDNGMF